MAEETSLIEIYAKNGNLYCYIPSTGTCYELLLGEEVELKEDFTFITQINLEE